MIAAPAGSIVQLQDLMFTANGDVPGCILLDWQSMDGGGVAGTVGDVVVGVHPRLGGWHYRFCLWLV